jgi:hypothetical protein
MDNVVINFINTKRIDSASKLFFLLFLHKHPNLNETCREFGLCSYLGDTPLLERIITDLRNVGLVDQAEHGYKLNDEFQVRSFLGRLAQAFDDPVQRQQILNQVKRKAIPLS